MDALVTEALDNIMKRMKMNSQECAKSTESDVCPICRGTGWELYKKDGVEYGRECSCGKRRKDIMANRVAFAEVPEVFKDMRLDSFKVDAYERAESVENAKRAVKAINYWLNEFEAMKERGMGLYLYSNTKGSGKTRISVSIANELMYEKQQRVKFATSLDIINEIKASWDRKGESESKLLFDLSTVDVLIIDDFGTEQAKDWIGERFYQIVNTRYVDKKITIFTSNYSLDRLNYDDRITNRIKERTFPIPFPEESVRDLIAKNNMRELMQGMMNVN